MRDLKVCDYMTRFPHSVGPTHSLRAAHRLMQRHTIRHLPVLENGKLLGIISQRDLYFVESLTDEKAHELTVAEAMGNDVTVCSPNDTVADVARTMARERLGSVVVIEGEKVVGIFTTIDALQVLTDLAEEAEWERPPPPDLVPAS